MQAKKRYLPGLLILAVTIGTLFVALAVHSADAAVPLAPQPSAPGAIAPRPTTSCQLDWRVVPSPNVGAHQNYLTDIDALSPDEVWAIGYYTSTGQYYPLTQRWDGHEWSIIPIPNAGYRTFLNGVEVIAPNDVWAVGSYYNDSSSSVQHLLTMHWNGTQWSIVPNPDPGGNYTNFLTGVDAVASNDVWAVGFWRRYSPQGLILHWNGSEWLQAANPTTGSVDSMSDVTVVSETEMWAVGWTSPNDSLIWHRNGTGWVIVPSPNVGPLYSVDAISQNDAWAIGANGILRWDGTQWTIFPGPGNGALSGVAAIATNDVWVVGAGLSHWNGASWTIVPNPSTTGGVGSISALGPNDIWAAGSYNDAGTQKTLVERYSYHCEATTTPTATPGFPTATSTPSPPNVTITPSPTGIPQTCFTLQGSISNSDPVQTGMLAGGGTPSPCNFNGLPCPGVVDSQARHYKEYRYYFPFGSFSSQCITVRVDATGCPGNIFSAAYTTSFDEDNICANLQGSTGDEVLGSASYQFVAYRGTDFSIVVHEVGPNTGCSSYSITVSTDTTCSNITGTRTATPTRTGTPGPLTQTPTRTPMLTTQTPSSTATRTATDTPRPPTQTPGGPTATPIPTGTIVPTASATAICSLQMADVLPGSTFYPYVRCLTCKGIVGGYPCGGQGEPCNSTNDPYFRPNNGITRGQIAKIVSEAAGFIEDAGTQAYEDVPTGSPFYAYINRLSNRGLIGGYPCGQMPGEPCVGPGNRPYFRPNTGATRGQLAKIVATAAGINDPVEGQFYADVPATNPFYVWVEWLTSRAVMGGYPCGSSPGEPCDDQDRPYFRWAADITRGQASKIVTNTFFPWCQVLDEQ